MLDLDPFGLLEWNVQLFGDRLGDVVSTDADAAAISKFAVQFDKDVRRGGPYFHYGSAFFFAGIAVEPVAVVQGKRYGIDDAHFDLGLLDVLYEGFGHLALHGDHDDFDFAGFVRLEHLIVQRNILDREGDGLLNFVANYLVDLAGGNGGQLDVPDKGVAAGNAYHDVPAFAVALFQRRVDSLCLNLTGRLRRCVGRNAKRHERPIAQSDAIAGLRHFNHLDQRGAGIDANFLTG